VSGSLVRDDTTVCLDDANVSVLQNTKPRFFMFLCTFKHANGFQIPNPIQSKYN